ncbi:Ig-like domain-containing protein [Pyxidicoccus sp. MSG2]|uniref:Ig-like domain-containing protein n=1 Tax=Pyxidicoccus sp. MSG2 TaxID=2996790 RepID=UPI00226FADF2|nr:Ig-like domain-containing protein [Pyxidicoccus sp. MSG2]MCY1022755.1 Ig-like domain-containing protein [Pyxidicoccus sp. MSG2]
MKRMLLCGLVLWLGACGPGVDAGPDGDDPRDQPSGKDTKAPTVASVSPGNGATEVDAATVLKVTFSEGMDVSATGPAFTLVEPAGMALEKRWSQGNSVLEVSFGTSFFPGQKVRWRIGTGARDVAGNALAPEVTGEFTVAGVADTTAPTVLSMSPVDTASAEPAGRALRVTFSEPMDTASAQAAFFVAKPQGVTGSFAWDGDTLVFTPASPWPWLQQVEWGVHAGAKDARGNALAADAVAHFTVMEQDVTRPTVAGPKSGATGVARQFELTLTFSEPMDRASTEAALSVTSTVGSTVREVKGAIAWTQGDRVLTLTAQAAAVDYSAFIGWSVSDAATDLSGNALVAASAKEVFRIVRLERLVLTAESGRDGSVYRNVNTDSRVTDTDDASFRVGDLGASSFESGNRRSRGFLSFDLSALDPNGLRITNAVMSVYQFDVTSSSPYTQWSTLTWTAVDYGTLDDTDFDRAGGNAGTLSTDGDTGWKIADLTDLAAARWQNRQSEGSRVQLRFSFDGPSDGSLRYAELLTANSSTNKPTLTVFYELP